MSEIFGVIKAKKSLFIDFLYNFFASVLSTGVLQLVLYPWLSRQMTSAQYGVILTIMGVVNTIAGAIGGSLNNARLVMEAEYSEKERRGDFLPMLMAGNILGMIAMIIYLLSQGESNYIVLVGVSFVIFASSFRNYASVYYRICLNYKRILILSALVAIGNIIGLLIIRTTEIYSFWFLVFLIGEVFGALYLLLFSDIRKDVFKFTLLAKKVISVEAALFITTLIANLLMYLDRLLLLPVLGGEAVSTYTVASFLGKSFGVIMAPLSGVLLSYYARRNYVMSRRKFWGINVSMLFISIPFFLACVIISRFITGLFYPTLIDEAAPYLIIANAAAILNTTGNMTQPAVLKFANVNWQIVIQVAYAVVYLGTGYLGACIDGLWGFTLAAVFASVTRLLLLYVVGNFSIGNKR